MRNIVFRGKRVFDNKWIYGSLLQDEAGHCQIYHKGEWQSVNATTVGQCTGMQDSDGQRIYEGDILNFIDFGENFVAEVVWNNTMGYWILQFRNTRALLETRPLWNWLTAHKLVCIGSIHDSESPCEAK